MTAKIALLDIETAPNLSYTWGKWDQNVIAFAKEWYMLAFSYKWLDKPEVIVRGLCDYPLYDTDKENDRELVTELWNVFDEADIIVAHNGDSFDVKKSNAKFALHDLPPPSTYKTVDTLKIAKKHFKFESNKLDDLGGTLGLGRKMEYSGGVRLWFRCMQGDPKAWKEMLAYNAQDVLLLEAVYLKLRPWMTNHPNLNLYSDKEACPTCQSTNTEKRGLAYLKAQKRQRHHCKSCGSWWQGKIVKDAH